MVKKLKSNDIKLETLLAIKTYKDKNKTNPTFRELQKVLGLASVRSVTKRISKLSNEGFLNKNFLINKRNRSIEVSEKGFLFLQTARGIVMDHVDSITNTTNFYNVGGTSVYISRYQNKEILRFYFPNELITLFARDIFWPALRFTGTLLFLGSSLENAPKWAQLPMKLFLAKWVSGINIYSKEGRKK